MSRNGSGTYTLPAGNPVVTGTTIESTWANTTLSDIATTLTDSLSRSGQGGMTAALRIADGTQGAPGLGFANETGSGLYRAGTGEVWAVVQGAQTMNLDANGVTVPSDKATSIEGTFVFNETGADKDARFEGDTDANLLFVDASADAVGIGTSSPGAKLDVSQSQNGQTAVQLTNSNAGASAETTFIANNGTYIGSFGVAGASKSAFGAILASDAYIFSNANVANTGITLMANSANGVIKFATGGSTEKMRLDASGNLGLGATPSAWSGSGVKAFDVGTGASFAGSGSDAGMIANAYFNGTNWIYKTSSLAVRYQQLIGTGVHAWYTAPSGTAGNAITFTQAMTLDASGRLLIGYTGNTDGSALQIDANSVGATTYTAAFNNSSTSTSAYNVARWAQGAAGSAVGIIGTGGSAVANTAFQNNFVVGTQTSSDLAFATNNTERARITSGGDLLVGTTTASALVSAETASSTTSIGFFQNTAATPTVRGLTVSFSNATGTNTSSADVFQVRTAGAERATIRGNGGFANYQANDANLSDERLKTDIQPAASYLDKICAIPVKTFLYKDQTDTERNLGVIAQDVDAVAPELVDRTGFGDPPEGESPYLAIYQTDLQYALMKCIQEQQELIKDLRARVAALEAQ